MATSGKVVFAYRNGQKNMGGKKMRVDQLRDIAESHLPERFEFVTAHVPRERSEFQMKRFLDFCEDAIVIFHKSAADNLGADARRQLRRRAAGICVDHLDVVVPPLEPGFFDVHIAASRAGEREIRRNVDRLNAIPGTQVRHLRHHADPRLPEGARPGAAFCPGYFGAKMHMVVPDDISQEVSIPAYNPTDLDDFLDKLSTSNFHLCNRIPSAKKSHGICAAKPFTKGFNAAKVEANILVNHDVSDAVYYLGDDYPFLIDDCSDDVVREGISRARDAFGTTKWFDGLSRMQDMKKQVAPAEVAAELRSILHLF